MPIKDEDIRISKKYEENPTSASAVDDYGIIMIPKPPRTSRPRPGLGFALKLADEDRFDESLSVTAYRSGAPQGSRPTTSSGKCVNPIINRNQLEYLVETEAGVSGCPVWLGYNRYPTVVAIQCVRTNHPISLYATTSYEGGEADTCLFVATTGQEKKDLIMAAEGPAST